MNCSHQPTQAAASLSAACSSDTKYSLRHVNAVRGVATDRSSFGPAAVKCRFLYVIGQLGSGGSERQLCYLLKAMDRKRYRPAVTVWNFCETETHVPQIRAHDVPLYYFPETLSATAKLRAFLYLVRRLEPEIIHSYSFYTNFAAWWASLGTKTIPIGSLRSE